MISEFTDRKKILEVLSRPIPHKWRVQSVSKHKPQATCVAYIDARDVADVLDQYCVEGWQNKYEEIAGNLFCGIAIKIAGEWEWRWDCGTESNTEKEKGRASDAFKRAAVKWGVGRFLYDLGFQYVPTNEAKTKDNSPFPVDEQGKRIWDLTEFLNRKLPKKAVKERIVEPIAPQSLSAPKEEKILSKGEIIEGKLKKLVSRFKRGQEWLIASLKGLDLTYETMTKSQFESLERTISTLDAKTIEEDLGILSETSAKLLKKGVAPEEVAKIGNALAEKTSPDGELNRTLKRLEPLEEDKEVSVSDIVTLINYLKFLGKRKEAQDLEQNIEDGLGISKKDFLEVLSRHQSAKNN